LFVLLFLFVLIDMTRPGRYIGLTSRRPFMPYHHSSAAASPTDSSAAATLLAEAVSDFLQTGSTNAPRSADSFLRAYSTLARSVPKTRRRALYQVMSQALVAAAAKEGLADPTPAASQQENPQQQQQDPVNSDLMSSLRSQEAQRRQDDIAAGRLLGSAEMRERLGISRQALSAAVRAQRLFVLAGPSGDFLYPAFFADGRHDRAVLEKVSRALGSLPGGAKWEFFTTPRLSLGRKTPLQALAKGQVEEVLAAAAAFADA
jgi:hypothetical protein